jgi:hypothetical protein
MVNIVTREKSLLEIEETTTTVFMSNPFHSSSPAAETHI